MKEIALAVMRLQPLHNGHKLLIDAMLRETDAALIGIGSIDKNDERNPFSFDERKAMLRAIYGDEARLKVFGLRDIGAQTKREWARFVLSEIARLGLIAPTCYYAGSAEDGEWFADVLPLRIVDRLNEGGGANATDIRKAGSFDDAPIPREIQHFLRNRR
ncbi:MAG: adenylyltransferase/cytidyltransferase family protein [Helicobacteraceae bacterium]|jgi:cytidyltransferase-like protein|nr:adenylyltransferase/cytidyltransferase family protein [Helicobacteraceae bacterium]